MPVLIFSTKQDAHAQAVSDRLAQLNVSTQYCSLGKLLDRFQLELRIGGSSESSCKLRHYQNEESGDDQALDLLAVSAIWLRRPARIRLRRITEPWAAALMESESNRAFEGLLRTLKCLWVNRPDAQWEATYKIKQLDAARSVGFTVPKTLITNNPAAVRDFHSACDGRLIYKLIDESSWQCFPDFEIPKGIPTLPLRERDLPFLNQVEYGLHLFQERIDKKADIRVTIVGKKVYAVLIESQAGTGKVDFRLDYSVPMTVHRLPQDIEGNCLKLLSSLGLNYGAIDLCLTGDGQYVFLEVNAQGQWLWMEERLGLPISQELSLLLAEQALPLVPV